MFCDATGVLVELDVFDRCWTRYARLNPTLWRLTDLANASLGYFPVYSSSHGRRERALTRDDSIDCASCDHMWTCTSMS